MMHSDGLQEVVNRMKYAIVLILVLMDDALWRGVQFEVGKEYES